MPEAQETFIKILKKHQSNFENEFPKLLKRTSLRKAPLEFQEAVHYSLLSSGKRVRASICLEISQIHGIEIADSMLIASSLECIHTYSLVHDDLPAMDNDDFRRGKASNHKAFGESTALLVGDCLQALGFELLSNLKDSSELVSYFAESVGSSGLVGGQFLDLQNRSWGLKQCEKMIYLKTGKLFELSVILPLLHRKIKRLIPFRDWGKSLGELFQITDDLEDEQDKRADSSNILNHLSKAEVSKRINRLERTLTRQAEELFQNSIFLKELPAYLQRRAYAFC